MNKRQKKETEKALVSRFGDAANLPVKERIVGNLKQICLTLSEDMEYYTMIDPDQIIEAIQFIKN